LTDYVRSFSLPILKYCREGNQPLTTPRKAALL
jgi:hypothetical protein